jgi:hypothetical protein
MCLAVYLGSDLPVEEIAWNEAKPSFHLKRIKDSDPVRRQFSGEHVYYAGSHEGCGCGFSKDGEPTDELEKCQKNYNALSSALSSALQRGARLQVFTCWEGEQGIEPESTRTATPREMVEASYELRQLELLNVVSDA